MRSEICTRFSNLGEALCASETCGAPGSLAGGFLVAVAGCARFVVLLLCSCLVLKRLLQEWSCLSFHFLTCTMGSAPIKWTCTTSIVFLNKTVD